MGNKLKALYKTLCEIETKGENSIIMADCLRFTKECIKEADEKDKEIENLKNKIKSLSEPATDAVEINKDEAVAKTK